MKMAKLLRVSVVLGLAAGEILGIQGVSSAGTALPPSGDPFTSGGLTLGGQFKPYVNTPNVNMWVCATSLFKGGAPTASGAPNPNEIPLASQSSSPARISGIGFSPAPKPMPLTLPSTFAYDAYSWPRKCSTPATFYGGSSSFANTVDVTAVWSAGNALLPTGSYSGYIQLYVATIP